MELRQRGHLWAVAAVAATAAIALHGGRFAGVQLLNARFDPHHMPVAAVEFIRKSTITEPDLFGPDAWGGYFIYELYPAHVHVVNSMTALICSVTPSSNHIFVPWASSAVGNSCCTRVRLPASMLPRDDALANVLIATREWQAKCTAMTWRSCSFQPSARDGDLHASSWARWFGKLVKIQEAKAPIVTHYEVYEERPKRPPIYLLSAIELRQQHLGRVPIWSLPMPPSSRTAMKAPRRSRGHKHTQTSRTAD